MKTAKEMFQESCSNKLEAVEKKISEATHKGETEVTVWDLNEDVQTALKSSGYSVVLESPARGASGPGYKVSWVA